MPLVIFPRALIDSSTLPLLDAFSFSHIVFEFTFVIGAVEVNLAASETGDVVFEPALLEVRMLALTDEDDAPAVEYLSPKLGLDERVVLVLFLNQRNHVPSFERRLTILVWA